MIAHAAYLQTDSLKSSLWVIVNIASVLGFGVDKGVMAYATAKAASVSGVNTPLPALAMVLASD
ncbi:MAG TPA: hypothetical protein VFN27_05645 [Xanthobacteraceae bacterium]|nr:hypothetical protein [Xanthobacteraceae bacterium]